MKLFLFAVGARDRASSRLRVWDHLAWLRQAGHEVRADSLVRDGVYRITLGPLIRILWKFPQWAFAFFRADAILVQESLLLWPLMLVKNLGKKRQLLFDFSDPVDRIGAGAKRRLRTKLFDLIVRRADLVVVENKAYLDLLRDKAADLVHFYGPVDATRYCESREGQVKQGTTLRIGWTGSPGTYKFIAPLMPMIDEIARERDIEVVLIGLKAIDYSFQHARLRLLDWDEDTEFSTLPSFDLGLFRLDQSEDALWRGAGKLFIYIAAGVPFIANDRGIAKSLMDESALGFRVAHEGEWLDTLRAAIHGDRERLDTIERSLVFAREALSYEAYRTSVLERLGSKWVS